MRGYNIWRPLMLIATALLTRSLVYNLCVLLGLSTDLSSNIAVGGMVIAGLIMYNRMNVRRRK